MEGVEVNVKGYSLVLKRVAVSFFCVEIEIKLIFLKQKFIILKTNLI